MFERDSVQDRHTSEELRLELRRMIVDLSHVFHDGMPGVRFKSESGEAVELTAHIPPYMTHAQSSRHYEGKASFEISDVAFQTSVGTKMDAPVTGSKARTMSPPSNSTAWCSTASSSTPATRAPNNS